VLVSLLALFFALVAAHGYAQQLTGTISGTAYDAAGAVIPNATVVLKNEASGDIRTSVTEADGHFVITAVQPATYQLDVTAPGFQGWEEKDIVMGVADNRAVPNIKLAVGTSSQKVEVVSGVDAVVPTDTAEISTSLNQKMIEDFPLAGRDAGELLKIMPGMALNNGGSQGSSFNARSVGTNNGPVGAYSSNGTQPNGTMAYMLDGANLVDPGNDGTQIANINPDMVGNIKVLTSNYGAEYAKGPSIFEAFSKDGGQAFHGEGYLYTHNAVLNSVDAYQKSRGLTNAAQSYYYMGGNVGGPVLLPFLKFNRNRNKLFFWGGYEYMKQQPAGAVDSYNVPNAAQLSGDFSNTGIDPNAVLAWPKFYNQLNTSTPGTATSVPTSAFDPNIAGVMALYPKPNVTPSAATGYTNYAYVNTSPQNRWEATGKLDYAISDNDKITGSYTYQKESDLAPISIWWATPNTLPYPTPGASQTVSYVVLTNYTHVFNSTTTNEAVFTWSHFVNPYKLADPSKVARSTVGFNIPGLYGNTTKQMPNFEPDYCCSEQLASFNYYPESSGEFGGIKQVPAFYDNFTKVLGNHTIKTGFYWDNVQNSQNSTGPDNGTYNFQTYGQNSTNNLVADMLLGRINSYQQQNVDIESAIHYHTVAAYLQDSFKAAPTLTVNYGLRFDHVGQWSDIDKGPGFQVFSGSAYASNPTANNAGLEWHAIDSSVPISGFKSPLFYWEPRLGLDYDIFGNGKTVFRGGFAVFRYQASTQVASAESGPLGSFEYTSPTPYNGYANTSNLVPYSSVAQNGGTIYAMQMGDDRSPFTNDWNATVTQALPHRTVAEISYVGNRSANEYLDGSNSGLGDINNVPNGAFFQKDPILNQYVSPAPPQCSAAAVADPVKNDTPLYCLNSPATYEATFTANDYRPLQTYTDIYVLQHAGYANYNSLQASITKQSGPYTFLANYTFSKVLGTRDGVSNNGPGNGTGPDPFNIRNDYGVLAYDHTHILNFTYNYTVPTVIRGSDLGMKLLGGAVNGWQASGYTAFQSGAPLQISLGDTMNASYPTSLTVPTFNHPNLPDNSIALPNSGLRAVSVSPSVWFGSNASRTGLIPALTCDPTKGLHQGQRFNPACFTTPAYGQQGAVNMPYMRNPNYWDSDLGIYKNFHLTETRYIQIRAQATNWLNHPLRQFGLAGNADSSLSFNQSTPATCSGCYNVVNGQQVPINIVSLSPTNTSTATGTPAFKTGSRFVTLAAKFYF
jgi:hypothetical protein